MKELKKNQPFHNHKHGTRLATRHATKFTCLWVNKPYYSSQYNQYLEAHDRKIIEMVNEVTNPITGSQIEYGDLIKEPNIQET